MAMSPAKEVNKIRLNFNVENVKPMNDMKIGE